MAACSEENHRDKLPMSREDKSERAWRLVKLGAHNFKQVNRATGVSESQFYIMRRKKKELGPEADDKTWMRVLLMDKAQEDIDYEDLIEREAGEMVKTLLSNFGHKTLRNVEVFARMIELLGRDMDRQLMEHWLPSLQDHLRDFMEIESIEAEASILDI